MFDRKTHRVPLRNSRAVSSFGPKIKHLIANFEGRIGGGLGGCRLSVLQVAFANGFPWVSERGVTGGAIGGLGVDMGVKNHIYVRTW